MSTLSMKQKLSIPSDQVWTMIGTFNGLPNWHPAVESSELEEGGEVRRLKLVGGGEIVERLESIDESGRTYTYSIKDSPLPLSNYKATIKVRDTDDGCEVEWSSEFQPAGAPESDAMAAVQQIYTTGLENLQKMFQMK